MLGPPDGRSNTSAAAELAEFRKFKKILRKNTIFDEHPVSKNVNPVRQSRRFLQASGVLSYD